MGTKTLRHSTLIAVFASCACSGGATFKHSTRLASGRDVAPAGGAPEIRTIRDLGRATLPGGPQLPKPRSDGAAVIGELLLIAGQGFGRGPRVTVDNRTAEQVAQTSDGSVVVRVPWGVRAGKREITVITAQGRHTRRFPILRYALATVPSADQVVVLHVTRSEVTKAKASLALANAHMVRFSSHGDLAMVSGMTESGSLTLSVLDMVAPKGPRKRASLTLPGERLIALTSARYARVACAVTDSHIVFIDISARPGLGRQIPLPKEIIGRVVTADIDPKGQRLALLLQPNELQLHDISTTGPPRLLASTQVLPRARAPLVHDMKYGANSETIWVASGDNLRSARRGRFPLRLTVIRIHQQEQGRATSFGMLSVWRTIDVPHRAAPVDLAVAHGQPGPSGRAVAVPPQNAAVFITAHDSKLLRLRKTRFDRRRGLRRAVRILRRISSHVGTVVRTDSNGSGGPMFASPSLLGPIDITSDSQLLLVSGAKVEMKRRPPAIKLVYGIHVARVWGKSDPHFIPLGEVDPETLPRPFLLGDVQVQP